jgi:hypothetical protein
MSMIADAFKPNMEDYASGYESENEFYHGQHFALHALLVGATALLEKNQENCDSCSDACDLLMAYHAGMEAAREGVRNTERPAPRQVSADEIRGMIGEGNLLVCVYSTNRDPIKEWFIIKPETPKSAEAA